MDVVFWHNIPSMILAPAINALSQSRDFSVTCIFCNRLSKKRMELGWNVPDFGQAKQLYFDIRNDLKVINDILSSHKKDSVNIISGLGGYKQLTKILNILIKNDRRVVVLSEAGLSYGLLKYLVLIKYKMLVKKYDKHIDGYLVIGTLAKKYFTRVGVPEVKQHLFIYQAPAPYEEYRKKIVPRSRENKTPLKVLFVGQIIKRKGVDVLLRAIQFSKKGVYDVKIAGCGKNQKTLMNYCIKTTNEKKTISWLGAIDSTELPEWYNWADVLVVPSRYDGWAAVVNEGLMVGLPVILSDACGAVDIIHSTNGGTVFASESVEELVTILESYYENYAYYDSVAANAYHSFDRLNSYEIGCYLKNVLLNITENKNKVQPPWMIGQGLNCNE